MSSSSSYAVVLHLGRKNDNTEELLDSSPVQKRAFSRIQHIPENATVPLHSRGTKKGAG